LLRGRIGPEQMDGRSKAAHFPARRTGQHGVDQPGRILDGAGPHQEAGVRTIRPASEGIVRVVSPADDFIKLHAAFASDDLAKPGHARVARTSVIPEPLGFQPGTESIRGACSLRRVASELPLVLDGLPQKDVAVDDFGLVECSMLEPASHFAAADHVPQPLCSDDCGRLAEVGLPDGSVRLDPVPVSHEQLLRYRCDGQRNCKGYGDDHGSTGAGPRGVPHTLKDLPPRRLSTGFQEQEGEYAPWTTCPFHRSACSAAIRKPDWAAPSSKSAGGSSGRTTSPRRGHIPCWRW